MSLRTNTSCVITPTEGHDVYGQELMGDPFESECAVVKLVQASVKTSVRTDSSASRSRANETEADARLLFEAETEISKNDRVEVLGHTLRVISVFPRLNIQGRHDHNQVDLMVWA